MTTEEPALIVNVSLASSDRDYDVHVTFLERELHLRRIGTNGDVAAARELVSALADEADVIAVTGIREARAIGLYDGELADVETVKQATRMVPVTDGQALSDVLQEWSVRHVNTMMPGYYTNARVVVLGGPNHAGTIRILGEFTENFEFADPLLRLDLPNRVASGPVLGMAADAVMWPVHRVPASVKSRVKAPGRSISAALTRREVEDAHVIVATFEELEEFGIDNLRGKSVISSSVSDERLAELAAKDVDMVLDSTPQPFDVTINAAVLEAMMLAVSASPLGRLTNDDLLDMVVSAGLEPRVLYPNGHRRRSRFAFVIHPLSQSYFTQDRSRCDTIEKFSPSVVMDGVEKVMAYAPPMMYSPVTGVQSPTGDEAEGWLITVGGTPKELLAHSPEFTYARLLAAAEQAKKLGAQVMGLGAFTKVVGDAGVTVAKQAPAARSPQATATAPRVPSGRRTKPWSASGLSELDEHGRISGKAMVVGATGAIGSVCARLLALASDDLYLISPETAKLLALKGEIEKDNPRATVHVAATPGELLARHGHDRHRHLRCGQEGARHHGGQARLRDHRCRPAIRPLG